MSGRFARQACGLVAVLVFAASRPAFAGPVTFQSGGIEVLYDDAFNGTDSKSFPVTFPGSATQTYDGTALDSSTPLGDDRGLAGVTYNLQDLADGAKFDVSEFHSNKGLDQRTLGGSVSFNFAFATDQALHYVFTADPTSGPATEFVAMFAGVTQDLHITALGDTSGSLLQDGLPVARTVEGDLPAGAHSLSVFLQVNNGRITSGGQGSGDVSIALSAGPPVAIPLPPAAWTGLSTIAATAILSGLRKLRRQDGLAPAT